jgi:hypothetical protein
LLLAYEVPQLGFPATPAKTPHVPAHGSHRDSFAKARACRAGVALRLVRGGRATLGAFYFFCLFSDATKMSSGFPISSVGALPASEAPRSLLH